MPISGNYDKGSFVGNYKDNTERTTTANKSVGLDPIATQSCLFDYFC